MKLISMVLYGTNPRYWYCLLPSLIAHWELYPGFIIRLYHTPEVKTCAGWPILAQLSKMTKRLELVEILEPYERHQPMMRRLMPLWEPGIEVFFTRDLDSVPSRLELASVSAFLRTAPFEYSIHAIRAHPFHTVILMGGLSGFRPSGLNQFTDDHNSWHSYFDRHPVEYDNFCDQRAMEIAFFDYKREIFDTPIEGAPWLQHSNRNWIQWNELPIKTANETLMLHLERYFFLPRPDYPTAFSGMPRDDMREEGKRLLAEVDCDSTRMVKEAFIEADFKEDFATL